jgi:hypothetical protein
MLKRRWFSLPLVLAVFLGSPAIPNANESYVYPSFYCSSDGQESREDEAPFGFAVYGKKPRNARQHPEVRLTDGEETPIWIVIEEPRRRWSAEEAYLRPNFEGKGILAELDLLPISIQFQKHSPREGTLYFARAYYGDPRDGVDYLCLPTDIGLPGGAMSGGN